MLVLLESTALVAVVVVVVEVGALVTSSGTKVVEAPAMTVVPAMSVEVPSVGWAMLLLLLLVSRELNGGCEPVEFFSCE